MDYKTFILGWVALILIIAIAHLWKSTLDDPERTKYESDDDLKWITNKIKEQRIPKWSIPMALKEIESMNTINEVKDEIVKMVMKYHDLKEDELFQRTDDVPFSPVQDCAFKFKNGKLLMEMGNYWKTLGMHEIVSVLDWTIYKYGKDDVHVEDKPTMRYVSEYELKQAIEGDVGIDLHANEKTWIEPFETVVIGTGTRIELPKGYGAEIRPRSSISKEGLLVHHGTIDNGYRGELMVTITNLKQREVELIVDGQRIAQLVLHKIENVELKKVTDDELSDTERGANGYGSTGK